MKTIVLDAVGVECALTAIGEKLHSLPKSHSARANYERAYAAIRQSKK